LLNLLIRVGHLLNSRAVHVLSRELGEHHKIDSLGVRYYLNLWFLDAWRWRPFDFSCSLGHARQIVVSNCLLTVRTSESGETARDIFNRIICVFILCNKHGPSLVEASAPCIVLELIVGLNIGSAT
jgi:hypothetical protein